MKHTHAIIECKNVSKEFGDGTHRLKALTDVSMNMVPGELVILHGQSGSGKSTLMHLIGGLELPTAGQILIRGRDISHYSSLELAAYRRGKIGIVFQQFNLIPTLSVAENVALPQLFSDKSLKSRMARAHHLLNLFGLDKYATNSPSELSGGEQQRVAVARALVNNPWILLFDEPTGNLDTKNGNELMELIGNLNRHARRTVLLVTHNPAYLDYAHRVLHLVDGKIVKEERRHELRHTKNVPGKWLSATEEHLESGQ